MTSAPPEPKTGIAGSDAGGTGESWGWTRTHRVALGILLFVFLLVLIVWHFANPARLDDPVVVHRGRAVELETRIDPNNADLASLLRVPHMSEKLAQAIIAYRESHTPYAAEGIVFVHLADLDRVPGIGKKVLEQIGPFLSFPGDATQPAPAPRGLIGPRPVPMEPEE